MRILSVTNMWPSRERPFWGAFVKSQVDSLVSAGITNTLYEIEGWRNTAEYLKAMARIPRLARSCRADLVHAHYGYSGLAAMAVKVPLVVSFCGDDLLCRPDGNGGYTLKSRALMRLSVRVAHRADAVIVKSEEMRRVIPDVPDVQVIPNGVDLARFEPQPQRAARAALGWRADGSVLLFAANRDEARKNFPLAQAVERRLRQRGLDVRLEYMFGEPQTRIVQAMNAADVLLLPSYHEGSPNAVKEAMALGLPVVAAPVGDCAELLCKVQPSAVAERSEEAFTEATARVLAAGRRSNGRAVIEASLTLEAVAHRVIGVYERALARGQRALPEAA
jgi:glycosyltransferase involved in cell wall biosynthesis